MALIARTIRITAAGLLFVFGLSAAAAAILSRGRVGDERLSILAVTSGSMVPVMHAGDAVIVRRADDTTRGALRPGAVVTFRTADGQHLVTHRIVSLINHADGRVEFVTKGDANADPDASPVERADVVGTIGLVVPFGGYALRVLRDWRVPVLLLLATYSGALSLSCAQRAGSKGSPEIPGINTHPPTTQGTTA